MEKDKKWIHSYSIFREVNKPVTTEEERDGKKVKVTIDNKVKEEVKFKLKKPNRKLFEDADFFYGIKLSEAITSGLLTRTLLLKRYKNDGGPFSENENSLWDTLQEQLYKTELSIEAIKMNEKLSEEDKEKESSSLMELRTQIIEQLQVIDREFQSLFEYTAETFAKKKVIYWWMFNIVYWDKNSDGNFVPFFEGDTDSAKEAFFLELDEKDDDFTNRAINKALYFVGYWVNGASSDDLSNIDETLNNAEKTLEKVSQKLPEKLPEKEEKTEKEEVNNEGDSEDNRGM